MIDVGAIELIIAIIIVYGIGFWNGWTCLKELSLKAAKKMRLVGGGEKKDE